MTVYHSVFDVSTSSWNKAGSFFLLLALFLAGQNFDLLILGGGISITDAEWLLYLISFSVYVLGRFFFLPT